MEDRELVQLVSRVVGEGAVGKIEALRDHWMKSRPRSITLKELSPLLHDYQRLITHHHIGKAGSNLQLVISGFCGKEAFRFYHVRNGSQSHMDDIPNLLAEYKVLLSAVRTN